MDKLISHLNQTLAGISAGQRCWVAYSGGLDSQVLLHATLQCLKLRPVAQRPELRAIHINHQLQPLAGDWHRFCADQCRHWGIAFVAERVEVDPADGGLEKAARTARYQAFCRHLQAGDVLLQAHHMDDQVETLLQRLLRGSGPTGLAAMPERRALGLGSLLRPLLDLPRTELHDYALAQGLSWQEDPSNQNTDYDRNFLRRMVLPVLADRWPDYRQRLAKITRLQSETTALLDEYLQEDLRAALDEPGILNLQALEGYSPLRQRNILRAFLQSRGIEPERAQLEECWRQFIAGARDAQPKMRFGELSLRRFRGQLYCFSERPGALADYQAWSQPWSLGAALNLPGGGRLIATPGGPFAPQGKVTVSFRRGGESCYLAGRRGRRSLKKCLQEWQLPPWLRQQLPLIYCDGELAAVADLALCEGYVAEFPEAGWTLEWSPGSL